ncbi:hypothetical protein J421_5096 (plasmid) [Gemmatirosa kalamazoonensis]|uniref:Uncharacterized protein n=1 Tax=Gemmatirosa kalamazoonensis TaxID=861299 RepID=W0RPH7_9BACT|nr:hypothetical protein [Gemmatirosa kalamazoonensis]AHG92631.1 hypothetical protein J421_5096 [Gemmatirosa kalamazoonensis]
MRRLLALLFTAAPFVAGAIAALSVRHDLRMLCMALAATLVARLVVVAAPARWGRGPAVGAALAAATGAAAVVAILFGARAPFGVGAVAVVLAGCATAGAALGAQPRRAA